MCFILSGLSLILSQAVEWSFRPAMDMMVYTFNLFPTPLTIFSQETLMLAWEEGLEMAGYSLLCAGVIIGVYAIQEKEAPSGT